MNNYAPFRECLPSGRRKNAEPPPLALRLPRFIGASTAVESILLNLRLALIGVGSVLMRVAEHLARLRVAELWLVDPQEFYKPESVLTHPVSRNFARPKVVVTARRCRAISPGTRVFRFVGNVQDLPLDAFANVHACLMATDNLAAEVEVGTRCLHLAKRLVHAAVHGESMTTQVRVFGNRDAQGPCPACAYGSTEWRQLAEQVRFSCASGTSTRSVRRIAGPPTRSTSHLCSLAADLAVNQLLRLVLPLAEPVQDTILEYCGMTNRTVTGPLVRNPDCPCDHSRFDLGRASAPLKCFSVERLARQFGFAFDDVVLNLTFGDVTWVERGRCRCAESVPVRRFVAVGRERVARCVKCRSPIRHQPFYEHRTISPAMLGHRVSTPLNLLGASNIPWVLLRNPEKAVLVQDPSRAALKP